jgi:hypothetical protein
MGGPRPPPPGGAPMAPPPRPPMMPPPGAPMGAGGQPPAMPTIPPPGQPMAGGPPQGGAQPPAGGGDVMAKLAMLQPQQKEALAGALGDQNVRMAFDALMGPGTGDQILAAVGSAQGDDEGDGAEVADEDQGNSSDDDEKPTGRPSFSKPSPLRNISAGGFGGEE